MSNDLIKYWTWFFKGSGSKPGFRRLLNVWMIFHLFMGLIFSFIVPGKLEDIANTVLLPLLGILIGLSFAWAGNAQALIQTTEIEELSKYHKGGFVEYVFVYQTAILAILITLILWAVAGLSVFDERWPTENRCIIYVCLKLVLFTFCSLTLRECWHVVMGAQWMLLTQRKIRELKNKNQRKSS